MVRMAGAMIITAEKKKIREKNQRDSLKKLNNLNYVVQNLTKLLHVLILI